LHTAIATRQDIAQAVGVVSKFNSTPTEVHLIAVKRILRYLKGAASLEIKYQKSDNTGYSDADWAGDCDNCHSTTCNLFIIAEGPVSRLIKKNLPCQHQKQSMWQ